MNSSVMMDIVIAAALVIFVLLGWKRGLVRTLAELLVVILALLLSVQISKAAAPVIVDRVLRPATYAAIEQRVDDLASEGTAELPPVDTLEQVIDAIPNDFIRERAQGLLEDASDAAAQALTPTRDRLEQAGKDVADAVLDGVVRDVIRSVLCAVCFVVLTILLRLAVRVLRLVEKIPGLRQLNELGGLLVGAGKGWVLSCLTVWILCQTGIVTRETVAGSVLVSSLFGWTGLFSV